MRRNVIAILDYDSGNVRSISNALRREGGHGVLTKDPKEIEAACSLIIPGVGAFGQAMAKLEEYGLISTICSFAESGRPILGICLGFQILMEESEEFGRTKGLGLMKGVVRKLTPEREREYRLPHIGWNRIYPKDKEGWEKTIFKDVAHGSDMYFLHSYAVYPEFKNNVLSVTKYGNCEFVSSAKEAQIFGCQFHPEKSGEVGLRVFHNFIKQGALYQ